jgi:hypothetical protein
VNVVRVLPLPSVLRFDREERRGMVSPSFLDNQKGALLQQREAVWTMGKLSTDIVHRGRRKAYHCTGVVEVRSFGSN